MESITYDMSDSKIVALAEKIRGVFSKAIDARIRSLGQLKSAL